MDVYRYSERYSNNVKFIDTIKAYTWHDSLEHIKNVFFANYENNQLIINCEKEFAFVERSELSSIKKERIINDNSKYDRASLEKFLGYKIY